jgi:hypothetical protein
VEGLVLEHPNVTSALHPLRLGPALGAERHDHARKVTTSNHEERNTALLLWGLELRLGRELESPQFTEVVARSLESWEEGAVHAKLGVGRKGVACRCVGRREPDDGCTEVRSPARVG